MSLTIEPTVVGTKIRDADGDTWTLRSSSSIFRWSWDSSPNLNAGSAEWESFPDLLSSWGPLELVSEPTLSTSLSAADALVEARRFIPRSAYVKLARALGVEPVIQVARVVLEIPVTDFDTAGDTKANLEEYLYENQVPDFILEGIRSVNVGPPGLFS